MRAHAARWALTRPGTPGNPSSVNTPGLWLHRDERSGSALTRSAVGFKVHRNGEEKTTTMRALRSK
ncbi:MAG: hypothetical protein RXR41_01145 [Candidatus Marsarchaeota archaeon]